MSTTNNDKFWLYNPFILIDRRYIYQLWPNPTMTHSEKLNAITRLVTIITIIAVLFTGRHSFSLALVIALFFIIILHNTKTNKRSRSEGFEENVHQSSMDSIINNNFQPVSEHNPYGNLLVTDILNNPERKPAPPAFDGQVQSKIINATKEMIQLNNPGVNTKEIFDDKNQEYMLNRSSLAYHTMPSTQVSNDQGAFAQFLYGGMGTCKSANRFNCNAQTPN